jgi:diguanylate cyclase (GGDEF)-like protein/hemerythrin-like metal-binding protein
MGPQLKVDDLNLPALHSLIQGLPFPVVLFDHGSDVGFANDRFAEVFLPGQLGSPDLHRLAHRPGGDWQAVNLRRRDRRDLAACAKAAAVADGVLLVIDEAGGQIWRQECERLQERIAELESLSATDALTGAWNRVQLERMVELEMSRAKRFGQPVTLILLDIDHFKRVNDVYGHLAGDVVLKAFVGRVRAGMRDVDSLFRLGGDEFVVLAPSIGCHGGAVLAERLRSDVAAMPFAMAGPLTASLGVTEHLEGESAESWFLRTDQALYAAKVAGRNRVHIDRQESADLVVDRPGTAVLQLYWQDAYECGEPTIDAEHRQLFDLGNALIAAAIEQYSAPGLWRAALESMLAHLAQHFGGEEVLMSRHGYARLDEHQRAHVALLSRADELKGAVERGDATLGQLVNFLVNDVIALHLFKVDTDFYALLRSDNAASAERAAS